MKKFAGQICFPPYGPSAERGAAIPLFAVFMLGVFAILALVIDFGILARSRAQIRITSELGALTAARAALLGVEDHVITRIGQNSIEANSESLKVLGHPSGQVQVSLDDSEPSQVRLAQTLVSPLVLGDFINTSFVRLEDESGAAFVPENPLRIDEPLHLQLLLDSSVSMELTYDSRCPEGAMPLPSSGLEDCQTRFEAAKRVVRGLAQRLSANDSVSLVMFGSTATTLGPVPANEVEKILAEMENLTLETRLLLAPFPNIGEGFHKAYQLLSSENELLHKTHTAVVLISSGNSDMFDYDLQELLVRKELWDYVEASLGYMIKALDMLWAFLQTPDKVALFVKSFLDSMGIEIELDLVLKIISDPELAPSASKNGLTLLKVIVRIILLQKSEYLKSDLAVQARNDPDSCIAAVEIGNCDLWYNDCLTRETPAEICSLSRMICSIENPTRVEEYAALFVNQIKELHSARVFTVGVSALNPFLDSPPVTDSVQDLQTYLESAVHGRRRNLMVQLSQDLTKELVTYEALEGSEDITLRCLKETEQELSGRHFNPSPDITEEELDSLARTLFLEARRDPETGESGAGMLGSEPYLVRR